MFTSFFDFQNENDESVVSNSVKYHLFYFNKTSSLNQIRFDHENQWESMKVFDLSFLFTWIKLQRQSAIKKGHENQWRTT